MKWASTPPLRKRRAAASVIVWVSWRRVLWRRRLGEDGRKGRWEERVVRRTQLVSLEVWDSGRGGSGLRKSVSQRKGRGYGWDLSLVRRKRLALTMTPLAGFMEYTRTSICRNALLALHPSTKPGTKPTIPSNPTNNPKLFSTVRTRRTSDPPQPPRHFFPFLRLQAKCNSSMIPQPSCLFKHDLF